ncbi:hypothetical protein GCM10010423_69230 [Streptomyces levis]|uniref:Uncharacterized protein n=1 Tax=Streptomyces levis TaxID=285566 RepID=A0ABP6BCT9_9ACTN
MALPRPVNNSNAAALVTASGMVIICSRFSVLAQILPRVTEGVQTASRALARHRTGETGPCILTGWTLVGRV